MIRVRYIGEGYEASFSRNDVYEVLDISIPLPKMPFVQVEDRLHDIAWWPFSVFEFIEGKDEFCTRIASMKNTEKET